jgi:uncharacterized membrane protein
MPTQQSNVTAADPADVQQNKIFAVLAYIGILVLIPLLAAKESKFAQYHAKQGLNLFIIGIIVWFITYLPSFFIDFFFLSCLSGIAGILLFVLAILGIVNALNGEMKPLPVIGDLQIIK